MTPRRLWLGLLVAALAACGQPDIQLPVPSIEPEPDPSRVDRVLFLLGDAGHAMTDRSPVLHVLQADVERWAGQLSSDSAVAVAYLGDIIYPLGLHAPDTEPFAHDTAVVMAQVRIVAGPNARRKRAAGYFIAGNHDWGNREDYYGSVRLKRLNRYLDEVKVQTGADVRLVPEPGSGGPYVLDWGRHVRLLMLDTAWWLLGETEQIDEELFLGRIEDAVRGAGDREVIFLAHHPFRSAGPHGGTVSFWESLGIGYVLRRSGAVVQDLNSPQYRKFDRGLRRIFERTGTPLVYAGGHEHSLQILERVREGGPDYTLVSGSGSKLTEIGPQPGLRFAESVPGYMRLLILNDGSLHLSVIGAPAHFLLCKDEAKRAECMSEGIPAFQMIHSQRLERLQ